MVTLNLPKTKTVVFTEGKIIYSRTMKHNKQVNCVNLLSEAKSSTKVQIEKLILQDVYRS